MFKHLLAAAIATTLLAAPAVPAFAQAATEKADKAKKTPKAEKTVAAKKELTPQQQKMKDCAPKWAAYKKEKNVKGRAEHNKFMSTCLKG
jgi:hypothetical protein